MLREEEPMFEKVNVPILGVVENTELFTQPETQEKSFLFGQGGGPLGTVKTGFSEKCRLMRKSAKGVIMGFR